MTKIIVDIKNIDEVCDDTMLVLYCRKPERKSIPWSRGREELDRNNAQFEVDSKQYQEDLKEYRKEIHKIHIGHAILIQDFEVKDVDK
jgi:hypothetical protein